MTSDDLEMHIIGLRRKFPIEWYAYHVHLAILPIFDPEWPFLTPKVTLDDLEMHIIGFRRKFPIEWYAYHMHLAIFESFDPKMTFFDP